MSKPTVKPKLTSRARRERLAEIERRWLSGHTEGSIRQWLRETFRISTRQCRNLISKVKTRVAASDPTDPNSARARAVQMLLETYRLAQMRQRPRGIAGLMDDPDTRTMATVVATLAKLEGAAQPEKIEHFGNVRVDLESLATKLEALAGSGSQAVTGTASGPVEARTGSDSEGPRDGREG